MHGHIAFTGARGPSSIDGNRIKNGHGARGIHQDSGIGVTWKAHLKAEWRTPIVTAVGVELRPFLTEGERRRAEAEFAVIGYG